KLASALEKEFGCPVSPAWLVEHSTVNALTDRLSRDLAEH
ncbi:MAG: acyl carrier protein, partial [Sinobacteraceae bacterium]|nr:acyl carrier protein [Nevskiaceae bacterium]